MRQGPHIPQNLSRLVALLVPRGRREDVLSDLSDGFQSRRTRLGEEQARRFLYREVASLLLWRLQWWRGAAATQETAGATAIKSTAIGRDFFQDLRFGLRTLMRQPGFSIMAVLVMGLGIGAPTVVLTLVNAIFFERPTLIQEPGRIVRLTRSFGDGQGGGALGNPDYLYYRENASSLSGLAAQGGFRTSAYTLEGEGTDQLNVLFVSDNFFDVLGVDLARGRPFLPEENATPGTHPVMVLAHHFWVRALGRDPDVLGKTLTLTGTPYTVVGIAPEGFAGVSPVEGVPDTWIPIAMYGAMTRATDRAWWERLSNSKERWLVGLGRLAPGVTFEAARDNLVALGGSLEYDGKSEGEGAFVQSQFLYSPRLEATLSTLSRMLLVVVGIVLLVAVFNVALLLLSRATNRYQEMGIRTALGAGRGRVIRQVLVETLLLGVAGGLFGLILAFALSDLAASLLPVRFANPFRPDFKVILVAGGLSVLTAMAVGILPALQATRANLRGTIQGGIGGGVRFRIRNVLVVGQVGLSMILVAGAFLFGRSFWTARTQDVGFATENRLVVQVNLRELDYEEGQRRTFLQQSLRRIREIPGVVGVSATRQIPFQGDWTHDFDAPPGARPNLEGDMIRTGMNAVGPDYFQVAGVPLLTGRSLGLQDAEGSTPAAVINETLAEMLWPGQDPLGHALPVDDEIPFEVVGVARDANYYSLGEDPYPQAYISLDQFTQSRIHFLVHTSRPAAELAPTVQSALRDVEPRLVFGWVTTMASVMEDATSGYEVSAILVGVFSGVALLLAASGLYGTVSFLVARRTREIGIRMALGANRGMVATEIVRFGLKLVGVGTILGLAGAVLLRRFTGSLLYGIPPQDPWPLLGASLVLLAVATAATLVPARQATRVDPVEAIRTE